MLFVKDSPVGVDVPIQNLQSFLYEKLKVKWGISDDTSFDSYGRVYRNTIDAGIMPEVLVSSTEPATNTNYKQMFFDDSVNKVVSFFDVGPVMTYAKATATVKAWAVFMVNVALLKPDIQHRADEEIRNDVQRLCAQSHFGFSMNESVTGYRNVFSEFTALLGKDQETFRDSHPLHCFRIGFNLIYDVFEC